MLNIRPEVVAYFKPFFYIGKNGDFIFWYGQSAVERWMPRSHLIPVTQKIWLAGAAYPDVVTDLYIGYSAADLVCFTAQRPHNLLNHPEQRAFAAVGLLPTAGQVQLLKSRFPFARWHLLFHADLLGKIADVALATWYKNHTSSFRVNDSRVVVKFRDKAFYFDSTDFSLHCFELATGLRSGIRTHKPPQGLLSFTALQNHSV